ncbi:hypothetical protein XELAEV_18036669mg [Xenopus laevis]|uniref:Uncharacterized protein n=1 Tax=Xenopus laevis TaxID=8355 RepID=A0A974CAM5_XENLA|nr:hypothetical protein XELAEV_18036669mg [Xenopus laevis]
MKSPPSPITWKGQNHLYFCAQVYFIYLSSALTCICIIYGEVTSSLWSCHFQLMARASSVSVASGRLTFFAFAE